MNTEQDEAYLNRKKKALKRKKFLSTLPCHLKNVVTSRSDELNIFNQNNYQGSSLGITNLNGMMLV